LAPVTQTKLISPTNAESWLACRLLLEIASPLESAA
jgi:hypothetical protein